MRQFKLRSGNTHTTCFLEDDKKLKVGNLVTLKTSDDPTRWWTIIDKGDAVTDLGQINQVWDVGGL